MSSDAAGVLAAYDRVPPVEAFTLPGAVGINNHVRQYGANYRDAGTGALACPPRHGIPRRRALSGMRAYRAG